MKQWKNKLRLIAASAAAFCLLTVQLHAADLEEPQRPGDVSVPAPYLSLQFDEDGNPYDPKGNADFTIKGGSVGGNTVKYQDQDYTVKSYRATGEGEYIDVFFKNIDSADTWSNFILSGCSFELFVQLDQAPGKTVGFFTSANGGGVALYIRQATSQLNFQVGNATETGEQHSEKYSMAQPNDPTEGVCIDGGRVAHVVGTYNEKDNTLNLYYNGVLVGSADFGTKTFNLGSAQYDHMGIGLNVSYTSESLGGATPYKVIRSNVYDTALTEEQVAAEYYNCIDALTGKTTPEEPTDEPPATQKPTDPDDQPQTSDTGLSIAIIFTAIVIVTFVIRKRSRAI